MNKRNKILLGAIFIVALGLLYGGISFLKGHNIFSSNHTYYVRYTDVTGLSNSSPIYVNGVRVGIVNDISYNYRHPGDIVVRIGINKQLPIPRGSRALLVSELLGSVSVKLELASDNGNHYSPRDTLMGYTHSGIRSEISRLMPQVTRLMPRVDSILVALNRVVHDPAVVQTLHHTEALTADAQTTLTELSTTMRRLSTLADTYQGVGEKLDTLAGKINTLTADERLNALLTNLDATVRNLNNLTDGLSSGEGTAGKLLSDPTLYDRVNTVCTEATALIDDIRKNPSRYIRLFGRSKE